MAQTKPFVPIGCDTLCNLTTPHLTLTMSQCPHCFRTWPSDCSLARHIKQCPNSHARLQQVLRALDPSQPDPFAPSNFDEDTIDFIPTSSPKHVPLSVEERAQLDPLRILGKADISLQIQDKLLTGPATTPLLTNCTTTEENFGYAVPSQAGSPF